MNGTNKALAGSGNNFVVGTDSNDDIAMANIWYSKDNDRIQAKIKFRLGTAILFDELAVRYDLSS